MLAIISVLLVLMATLCVQPTTAFQSLPPEQAADPDEVRWASQFRAMSVIWGLVLILSFASFYATTKQDKPKAPKQDS